MSSTTQSQKSSIAKRNKRPTMKDVAGLANVSVQTVSAVVNGKPGITQETSFRVREAIKQLGYRPDYTARSLRSGQRRTIALFVSDISNSVLGLMASASEDYAYSEQYNLILYNTHDDPAREMSYVNTAAQGSVDGVIFLAAAQPHKAQEILEAAGIPSIIVDRIPEDYSGPSVGFDNIRAGRMAGEHLLELGHIWLAHIPTPPSGLRLAKERREGFVQAIEESGKADEVYVEAATDWGCEPGYEAMQRLLKLDPRPTAVFAASDHSAIGAMHAIREAGLRVPEDISVIGLDNIAVAAFQNSPLTSIQQPLAEMAALGVRMLLDILAGKEPEKQQVVLDPVLVLRQSTAPPKCARTDH